MRSPIEVVVVTGGTRGIGEGLVRQLHARGAKVAFCGTTASRIESLSAELGERALGRVVDVRRYEELQAFWDATVEHFGKIDAWVNNAGLAHAQHPIVDLDPERIRRLIETNVMGATFASQVALRGFQSQGRGWLFNMEGLGSDGRYVEGLTGYGLTKAALHYLDEGLFTEVGGDVRVCSINPGMVMTRLVLEPYKGRPEALEAARRMFNILADRVETVTPWLAGQILEGPPNGTRIKWLTRRKAAWRFLSAPFSKRSVVPATV